MFAALFFISGIGRLCTCFKGWLVLNISFYYIDSIDFQSLVAVAATVFFAKSAVLVAETAPVVVSEY